MSTRWNSAFVRTGIAAAITAALGGQAYAMDFTVGDDWKGSWTSSVSIGSSWRAHNISPAVVGVDAPVVGIKNIGQNSVDEGDLNYKKGDAFTTLAKLITEVEMKNGKMGFLVRGKAWYDFTLKDENPKFGNEANGYSSHRALNDSGLSSLQKYSGTYLLDAYVYDTFQINGYDLQVRVGNQVVNWGESLFIQGVNYVNPIDVPSYHKPGAQLKEVFLPIPVVYLSQSLGSLGSLEAFWQWNFVPTPLDLSCGGYWSVAQANIGTNQGKCQNSSNLGIAGGNNALAAGVYIPGIRGPEPKDNGNWGLAYHFNAPQLDSEIGLYYEKLTARTPVVGAQFVPGHGGSIAQMFGGPPGVVLPAPGQNGHPQGVSTISAFWEYPSDIKIIGVSLATVIKGWSTSFELSQKRDFQAQIDGNDLLGGCLANAGPAAALCMQSEVGGPNAASGTVHGGTKTNITQFQINTLNAGQGILGAGQWVAVGEVGFQRNNLPNYHDNDFVLRYNRAFVFGAGAAPASYGGPCGGTTPEQCANDGYVTKFSWGYRLLAYQTYPDLFMGVTVIPQIFWSEDVQGVAADSTFSEGKQALGLSVKFSYQKKYVLELGSTTYNHRAHYDALRDRDFYSATFTVNF